jgi:hypothetical protein
MNSNTQQIIDTLFANMCGYGFADKNCVDGKAKFAQCLNAIPTDLLPDFLYSMYRIADKSGPDGFDIVVDSDDTNI